MGQDSTCFTASVYIDGKKAGTATDDGNGGCHDYHPHDLRVTLTEIAATMPAEVCRDYKQPFVLVPNADTVIDRALDDHEARKGFNTRIKARILRRTPDGKITQSGRLLGTQLRAALTNNEFLSKELAAGNTLLNTLPDAEAFAIYKQGTSPRRKVEEVPNVWGKAWDKTDRMMRDAEGLEPTSALKQAASDVGIPEGEPMAAFVTWALALIGEGAL
jgi:hypothetical protein